jgi:hypothetical protein
MSEARSRRAGHQVGGQVEIGISRGVPPCYDAMRGYRLGLGLGSAERCNTAVLQVI